jgi:hypothetical protein
LPYAGWDTGASTQLDATGENGISSGTLLYTGQEIVSTSYKKDGTIHYFRLDILGQPEATKGNYFSGIYGIAIDSKAGGADGSTSATVYDPPVVTGIDYLLDSHWELDSFDPSVLYYVKADLHEWDGSTSYSVSDLTTEFNGAHSHDTGTTYYQLEWSIDESIIGTTVDQWYGYTLDGGSANDYYDLVPEPTTLGLMSIGGLAVLVRRRRR